VPTDFSNNSYNALFYAAQLFKEEKCNFHIVNVCGNEGDSKIEEAKIESAQGLDSICHRLIRDVGNNKKHQLKKVSLCSNVTKGICDYAEKHKVGLMVIGNKAKEEVKHILFGTNAMQLVREVTTCPILIVPLEIDFKKVEKIAFISNYANPISKENIHTLQFFQTVTQSAMVPMSIDDGKLDKDGLENKNSFFKAFSKIISKEVVLPVFEDKTKTILEFVDLWSIDMLCMVYYPHHFFLEFIGNGIIKELNTKLSVPFLILPNRAN
jgi:nucleotide-binding universal stress UspA family protein